MKCVQTDTADYTVTRSASDSAADVINRCLSKQNHRGSNRIRKRTIPMNQHWQTFLNRLWKNGTSADTRLRRQLSDKLQALSVPRHSRRIIITTGLAAIVLTGCAGPAETQNSTDAVAGTNTGRLLPPSKPLPKPTRLIPPTAADTVASGPATPEAMQAPASQSGLSDSELLNTPGNTSAVSNELIVADIRPEPDPDVASIPTVAAATPELSPILPAQPQLTSEELLTLANNGDIEAQVQLATAYRQGDDALAVDQNMSEAYYWYQRAAAQGDSTAQYQLGLMHFRGSGVAKDYTMAREWWLESATLGNADAQQKLGYLYSEALGVERDYNRAVSWYTRAARLGHAEAQTLLGSLYHEGNRIPQNYREAFKWYKLAAERGHPHAQYTLATLYHDGFGTEQDFVQCTAWVDVAVANGYLDEFDARQECSQHLDEKELRRAETLAKRWQTTYPKLAEYN